MITLDTRRTAIASRHAAQVRSRRDVLLASRQVLAAELADIDRELFAMVAGTLTPRQRQVCDFIASYTEANGQPPSIRELARHLGGISTNAVHDFITAIARKGALEWRHGKARSLRLIGAPGAGT